MKAYLRIQRSGIDFFLSALAAALTVYSLGISLSFAPLGLLFVALIGLGASASHILSKRFSGKWFERIGMFLYVVGAFASPFVASKLNMYLPAEGFPRELLLSAAPLTWMIAIGSFFAWRDQTLLFQCVPCIALFGLVGAFNTFDGATITFFIFLFSASILYARSHQRTMLERASRSGYPKIEAIHGGPWRYMAGPEWGLLSAAIVIILSAIGAPIIQLSVRQVSGVVSIRPPQVQPPAPTNVPSAVSMGENRKVGQGPVGRLSDRELFRIKLSEPRYLRIGPFNIYSNGAWSRPANGGPRLINTSGSNPFPFISEENLKQNFDLESFWFRFSGGVMAKLPIPTPFNGMDSQNGFSMVGDGTVAVVRAYPSDRVLRGEYYKRKPTAAPERVPSDGPAVVPYKDVTSASLEVVELARSVTATIKSPVEKAYAIKREIERRSKYNLNAEAAPEGEDPVRWFLLGPKREGYCDLFASAMVLMARAADLPARYVVGYYPVNHEMDKDGFFVLRESDAHAWAELYFDGVGWIPFDATEGAEQVPGGERGSVRDSTPFYEADGFWAKLTIGLGIAFVSLLGWYVVAKRSAISAEELLFSRLRAAYELHVQSLEIASGKPKWVNESPSEFFHRIEPDLGPISEAARDATGQYSAAFYGPKAIAAEEVTELESVGKAIQMGASAIAKNRRKGII